MEIPQSPIEGSLSQQDGEQSPLLQEVLPGSLAASRFAGGNPTGPGSSHPLRACSALHPWAGGGGDICYCQVLVSGKGGRLHLFFPEKQLDTTIA